MPTLREYRLRIGNAGLSGASLTNFRDPTVASGTAVTVTSVAGGTNPYFIEPPSGDGSSFDALTGRTTIGQYRCAIADAITSGTDRVLSAVLFDSTNRVQLLSRPAILEYRENAGTWAAMVQGFVTRVGFTDGVRTEVTISDQSRVARLGSVFLPQPSEQPNGADDATARATKLAAWMARWPTRGCLLGGVIGAFLNYRDLGGWIVTCERSTSGENVLRVQAGYDLTCTWSPTPLAGGPQDTRYFQRGAGLGAVDTGWISGSDFPAVIALVDGTAYAPCAGDASLAAMGVFDASGRLQQKLIKNTTLTDPATALYACIKGSLSVNSTRRRLRYQTVLPTVDSPIYVDQHPVDLLAALWAELGEPYNSTAVTTVKQAIGTDLRVAFRITEPQNYADFIERNILGPFGVGMRRNASGQMEPFTSRAIATSAPSTTIDATVVADQSVMPFDLAEETQVGRVLLNGRRLFAEYNPVTGATVALDRTVTDPAPIDQVELTLASAGYGAQDAKYELDGMIHRADSVSPDNFGWTTSIARDIAYRQQTGGFAATAKLIRGATGVNALGLGDEVLWQPPMSRNANKAYGDDTSVGARIMQIVKLTERPATRDIELIDTGPNLTFSGTTPAITLAAASDAPKTTATVTITNAATLNAASPAIGVRLQMAVTTGAAPASTQYADVAAFPPGQVPTTAIYLPPVVAGRTVYVRQRGESLNRRPQAWQAATSLGLTALTAPSGSTTASVENKSFKLSWTAGSSEAPVEVVLHQGASAPGTWTADKVVQVLPPGSVSTTITGLVASTQYVAGARVRLPDGSTSSVGAAAAVTTNAAASASWASAPTIAALASTPAPQGNPGYRLTITPGHVDASLQVQVDTSGAFGTAVEVGTFPPGTTEVTYSSAADSVTRYFRARHVSDTKDPSSWSASASGTPINLDAA